MKRLSILVSALLFCGAVGLAQEPPSGSPHRNQLFSSDLVSWSYMQQPKAPESGDLNRPPEPTPETQPSPAQQGAASQTPPPAAQRFTGTVDKESGNYVLRVSAGIGYQLDSDQRLQTYVGRRVQVTGTLDRSSHLIHVDKVEPIS
jgi:Protein of unknown function (DUF5818)